MAESGGARSCVPEVWKSFLQAATLNKDILNSEFLENDERCMRRFTVFRRKQAALMKVAGFAVRKDDKRPILIGMGHANVSATMRGCHISIFFPSGKKRKAT